LLSIEQSATKTWTVFKSEKEFVEIKLQSSSITNKFEIVVNFINNLMKFHKKKFEVWFFNFLKECENEETRAVVIDKNIDIIKNFVDGYIDGTDFDYTKFVDESKAKKGSILFQANEIKAIIRLSSYLKVYSFLSNSENLNVGDKLHKHIYNRFAGNLIETEVASKIFDVVKTKTFRYNMTDRFMWDYIKSIQCKDIGIHIVEIFNFIMNNIIILCEEDKNPITYFVGVIDESVKWFLRSVYKGSIVYDDSISTEDIHGINVNNLRTYSFNDTLGRLKAIAFQKVYEELEKENAMTIGDKRDEYIITFNQRLSSIEYISPLCNSLVYPLLSRMTQITYIHFKTISSEHAAVLSYYVNILLQKAFKGEYKSLFSLLDYYPLSAPSLSTTYKIKSVQDYLNLINKIQNFYGFNSKIFPYEIMSHFVGRVSRINFCHLLTGQKLSGIPLGKVEQDIIHFFVMFFSGKFEKQISEMTKLMNEDF
jgi:hypothetical protein